MINVRSIFLVAALGLIGFSLHAQINEGIIEYEYRMDIHRNIPPEREQLKAMIPQFQEQKFVLFFNESESLYKATEEDEAMVNMGMGGGMRISMNMPRAETYVNKQAEEVLVMQDFVGKTYLISEPLKLGPWRVGNEMMEIAGYMCMMAWYNDTVTNQEVTAWFTMEIRPFTGPDRFVGLPGAVLALDINNGERVWVARKIEEKELAPGDIRVPGRGERLTREAYEQMVKEQRERMGARGGAMPFGF